MLVVNFTLMVGEVAIIGEALIFGALCFLAFIRVGVRVGELHTLEVSRP